uniref:Uncharacterized protein n=1 Tax=Cannabis sativa TaxID=3483 RepID=A0A803PD20_CANSA
MRALLVQEEIQAGLLGEKKLLEGLIEKEKGEIMNKAHNAITLSIGDKVLEEVSKEQFAASLWLKLESLYVTKSLAN